MPAFQTLAKAMSLPGAVLYADADASTFTIVCRTGDQINIEVTRETVFGTLANLDELNRDRIPRPGGFDSTGRRQPRAYWRGERTCLACSKRRRRPGRQRDGSLRHFSREHQAGERRIYRTHRHEKRLVSTESIGHIMESSVRVSD